MPEDTTANESPPDLTTREDIEVLVNTFYEKVRTDDLLGFIFDEIAVVNWEEQPTPLLWMT